MHDILEQNGECIFENELKSILKLCKVCRIKDKQYFKTCQYVGVKTPGEKIGIDILEIEPEVKYW